MPAILARLIVLLLAAGAVWAAIRAIQQIRSDGQAGVRKRNGQSTYKPRGGGSAQADHASGANGAAFVMTRQQLAGLRDAMTSAAINVDESLACCGKCLCVYHMSSVRALQESHAGACVGCGSKDLSPVHVAD